MSVAMDLPQGQTSMPSRSRMSNRLLILALWQRRTFPGPIFLYFKSLHLQPEHLIVNTLIRFRRRPVNRINVGTKSGSAGILGLEGNFDHQGTFGRCEGNGQNG